MTWGVLKSYLWVSGKFGGMSDDTERELNESHPLHYLTVELVQESLVIPML